MQKQLRLLQELSLSPTASKVYLSLLTLGKGTADKIAKKAGSYKANIYDALERLTEAGLVTEIFEDNKRFFIPTNPDKLPQIIADAEQKELERMSNLKNELKEVLPLLHAQYHAVHDKELFEIYRGRKAYKAIINEIAREKPKFWKGFGNFQVQKFFPIEFQRWFKKIPILLFSNKSPMILKRMHEAEKITKVTVIWLPEEVYMPVVWVVFGENLLIIIYEPEIIVLRIKSKQVVDSFSHQFDYLWKKYRK